MIQENLICLVDMDNVVANFERGVLDAYRGDNPDKPFIRLEDRTTFLVRDQYPEELRPFIDKIYTSEGFYLGLLPIPGAIEALQEMVRVGMPVYICTAPLSKNRTCLQEKQEWVVRYLGKEWIKRLVTTDDKTLLRAGLLIDDKPEISGLLVPTWEHVLYSQPYNAGVTGKRRMTWENWREVLLPS